MAGAGKNRVASSPTGKPPTPKSPAPKSPAGKSPAGKSPTPKSPTQPSFGLQQGYDGTDSPASESSRYWERPQLTHAEEIARAYRGTEMNWKAFAILDGVSGPPILSLFLPKFPSLLMSNLIGIWLFRHQPPELHLFPLRCQPRRMGSEWLLLALKCRDDSFARPSNPVPRGTGWQVYIRPSSQAKGLHNFTSFSLHFHPPKPPPLYKICHKIFFTFGFWSSHFGHFKPSPKKPVFPFIGRKLGSHSPSPSVHRRFIMSDVSRPKGQSLYVDEFGVPRPLTMPANIVTADQKFDVPKGVSRKKINGVGRKIPVDLNCFKATVKDIDEKQVFQYDVSFTPLVNLRKVTEKLWNSNAVQKVLKQQKWVYDGNKLAW
jgi:N-terminal domain of argonaute